jgi:hypothetical protein
MAREVYARPPRPRRLSPVSAGNFVHPRRGKLSAMPITWKLTMAVLIGCLAASMVIAVIKLT